MGEVGQIQNWTMQVERVFEKAEEMRDEQIIPFGLT